jgi:hypothetical protein
VQAFPPELAGVIKDAYAGGSEVTLAEVALCLGMSNDAQLDAITTVLEFLESMSLHIEPGIESGDFWSVRVLRSYSAGDNATERALRLMNEGESLTVEFKSSLFASMKDWKSSGQLVEYPGLVGEVLKTICAFLNSEGGDLLIGVADSGEPSGGIELDMDLKKWNFDKWQLHLASLINGRFHDGRLIVPYVKLTPLLFEGTAIVHAAVAPRAARSFVQRDARSFEFFVRNGPRTESLDLIAFEAHLRARIGH